MSAERFQAAMRVFQEVCDLTGAAREAALVRACGSDMALRAEVEALLQQDAGQTQALRVDAMLDSPQKLAAEIADDSGSDLPTDPTLPKQIGQYRILRRIGEGGMGMVYEARQQSPRRTVAIKVLRPSGNWSSLQKRFEHEAYILGRLQHPGIAQIYEAGRENTPAGDRLYLVMELVRGRDLIRYCETQSLGVRPRIELIIRVCEAVQHAHQKAVIHRDLKPANILVSTEDSTLRNLGATSATRTLVGGQPKILDFGVARLTDSDLQLTTVQTGVGQLIGTLPYMSPEQVAGDPAEVDTRADVYSLGVILHELLTGQLPYDLRNRSMLEAARIIREEMPARLSTMNRALRGDLETVVGKALEKDKRRRYQSAAELASDLQAYLDGAPITARRDSRWYVMQKTLQRYRLVAGLAAGLLLISVGASIAMGVLYRRANAAAIAAKAESARASKAEAAARKEARQAAAVRLFMEQVLHAADSRAVGRDAKIIDALQYAEGKVNEWFANDPFSRATAWYAMAQTFDDMGEYEKGLSYAQAALRLQREMEPDGSADLVRALINCAAMQARLNRWPEGIEAAQQGLTMMRTLKLADRASEAWALSTLGALYSGAEKLDVAENHYREALELYAGIQTISDDDRAQYAGTENLIAVQYYKQRRIRDALPHAEHAVELFERITDPAKLTGFPSALNTLGGILEELGETERARGPLTKSLEFIEKQRGPDHPETANALLSVAQFERVHGGAENAEQLYRRGLKIRRNQYPSGHPGLGQPLTGLGATLVLLKRFAEAEPLLREAYEMRIASAPREYTTALTTMQYGVCLYRLNRVDEAYPLLKSGFAIVRQMDRAKTVIGREAAAILIEIADARGNAEEEADLRAYASAIAESPSRPTSQPASAATSAPTSAGAPR